MTVILHQFPGAFGMNSLSPFCTKAEAYLRIARVPYTLGAGDPRHAPLGKLPYADFDGERVADSSSIIARCQRVFGDPLDAGRSPAALARGHLVKRVAEEHLYWGLLFVRWVDDEAWHGTYRDIIAAMLPAPTRFFLPGVLRSGVIKATKAHGLGRHDIAAMTERCAADLDAFETLLEGSDFFGGDTPMVADLSAYAMIEHLARTPTQHPLVRALAERPALRAYAARVHALAFGA